MPKGFSEHEKQIIREQLLQKGQALFEGYGLRKTTVDDLTRAVGISKGAFYLFYDSKEALYMEIAEKLEESIQDQAVASLSSQSLSPRESIKALLRMMMQAFEQNPMFQTFRREEYEGMLRKLPPERIQQHLNRDEEFVRQFIAGAKAQGIKICEDASRFSNLTKALFFVSLHRNDYSGQDYQDTIELLIEMIGNYLVEE